MKIFRELKKNRIAYLFLSPALLVMLIIVGIPLLATIYYSFTNMNQKNFLFDKTAAEIQLKELQEDKAKLVDEKKIEKIDRKIKRINGEIEKRSVKFTGFKNYIEIFGDADSDFWRVLIQTVIWTIVNVSFHFGIGLFLAIILNKNLKGNTYYRTLLMVPWAIPSFVAAFSWRFMYNYPDGLINSILSAAGIARINFLGDPSWMLPSCVIVNVWAGVPFMMITLLGALQGIDESLYEAADIDGASRWQQFWNVTLPLLKPVASVAILLGIIWTFNMFNIVYLVTLGNEAVEKDIFVTYAYKAFSSYGRYGISASYAVIILSILLTFGSYYVRLIQKEES